MSYSKLSFVVPFTCVLAACSTTDDTGSAQSIAPNNVLSSSADVKAAIADKQYIEFSNSLQVNMITVFGSDNTWKQTPPGRETFSNPIRFESDGRVCNVRAKSCFYVRPTATGFDMVGKDGSVGKSLKLAS